MASEKRPAGIPAPGRYILGQPGLVEQLIRALSLKGYPPSDMDARMAGNIELDSMMQPEYLWLRRWQRIHFGVSIAAVAAQFATAFLAPSPGTTERTLGVLDAIILGNPNAAAALYNIQLGLPAATIVPAASFGGYVSDDRANPFNLNGIITAFGVGQHQAAASAVNAGGLQVRLAPGTSTYIPLGFCLTNRIAFTGGNLWSAVLVGCAAVNTAIDCSFIWRERALLGSELI